MHNVESACFSRAGIETFGTIKTEDIVFDKSVRKICEENLCRNYNKSWACPPALGTFDECRRRILAYKTAIVFSSVYKLEDSFDFEGMLAGHRDFKKLCDNLYNELKNQTDKFLLLSNEGCQRCDECTWPDAPCRFPDKLFPSAEGFGILVAQTAAKAGLTYKSEQNTVTYFGVLCL